MAVELVDNNAFIQQIIDKGKADASKRNTGDLGKEEFLNLLVLQLRYQDPLNPVEDKEFIAQMAQFSALEQMQNMNSSNMAMKGFSMIGKYVTGTLSDEATGINRKIEGHVESVVMKGSKTFVVLDGKEVPIENIYNVADGFNPLNSSLSAYTGLIGYLVKGAVYDISTGEIVGVSGEVVSLAKGAYEDFAMLNGVEVMIAGIDKKGEIIEDRAKLKEYLEGIDGKADPKDRHIEIFITDENGKKVPIAATLRSFEIDSVYGTVKAVLDDVGAPVTSVASIKKLAVKPADEALAPDEIEDKNKDKLVVDNIADGTGETYIDNTTGGTGETDVENIVDSTGETGETGKNGETGETGETPETELDLANTAPEAEQNSTNETPDAELSDAVPAGG